MATLMVMIFNHTSDVRLLYNSYYCIVFACLLNLIQNSKFMSGIQHAYLQGRSWVAGLIEVAAPEWVGVGSCSGRGQKTEGQRGPGA